MENIEKKVIRISKKKLVLAVTVLILIIIILLGLYLSRPHTLQNSNNTISSTPSMEYSQNTKIESIDYYQYRDTVPLINDTREFLKTNYNAQIETRNVKSVLRNVKSSIKVANGRIDQLSESPTIGYVSFVIPKINFDDFKDQIESITNEKLIIENISSENLLNQKQNIEEQNLNTKNSLIALQQQQKDLLTKHNQTIKKIKNNITELDIKTKEINSLLPIISDNSQLNTLKEQQDTLIEASNQLKQQLLSENSNFNTNNENYKNQINNINIQLDNISKQDTNFTNNIETVNGSISIKWISLWQLIKIFSPIHPTFIIIFLIIIIFYLLKRKNYLPKVELF